MLEQFSESDVLKTIDSLRLTLNGTPQEVLTKEDYKRQLSNFRVKEETLHIDGVAVVGVRRE